MAISIQELRKPHAPENPWQSISENGRAASHSTPANPFHVAPVVSANFPWQAQTPTASVPQPGRKPRSRGILKFVNYLYDQR
jgi:hypothetical protein